MSTAPQAETPTVPGGLPLLGHALDFGLHPLKLLASQQTLADITALRIGPMNVRIVNDPDLVREVLVSRPKDFIKSGPLYEISSAFVGNGLAISEGPVHRRQRRLIQPAFRRSRMPDYQSTMREAAEQMTRRWQPGQRLDIWSELFHLAVGVIGNMLSGGGFPRAKSEQIVWAVSTASKGIGWRSVTPVKWAHSLPTPENKRFTQAQSMLEGMARGVIADHRALAEPDPEHFLSLLLAGRDDDEQPLTTQQLIDEVVTLFSAGSATVATSLAWAFHLISNNPEVEVRARTEIRDVLGSKPVTSDDLPRLEYLGRVLTEVLRLYPPAWLLPRVSVADTRLGEHHIPKDTQVFYSPYSIHRDPRLYPDPDRFDPDRWSPEQSTERSRSAYLPFGAGVHQCVGNNFALTEAMVALATIIPDWSLSSDPSAVVGIRSRALLEPKGLVLVAEEAEQSAGVVQ